VDLHLIWIVEVRGEHYSADLDRFYKCMLNERLRVKSKTVTKFFFSMRPVRVSNEIVVVPKGLDIDL
jgi:hypothetical protein